MKNKEIKKKIKIGSVVLTAHQLKKPLSSMKLSLGMLLGGDFGALSNEQKDIIIKIVEKNEILISLVDDLLSEAKIKERKISNKLDLVNIEDIIKCLINLEKEEIASKNIDFKFEKEKDLPPLRLDKEKISIALQNIFDNAIKYTPVGGKITLVISKDKNNLEIKISDSGIGIPENQKEMIFSKFFRADNNFNAYANGSGLGLSIVKDIIDAHGGKVWLKSEEGKGSEFFISLPIK